MGEFGVGGGSRIEDLNNKDLMGTSRQNWKISFEPADKVVQGRQCKEGEREYMQNQHPRSTEQKVRASWQANIQDPC